MRLSPVQKTAMPIGIGVTDLGRGYHDAIFKLLRQRMQDTGQFGIDPDCIGHGGYVDKRSVKIEEQGGLRQV